MSESEEEEDLFAGDDSTDPTIMDNAGQGAKFGWALNQRDKWASSFKVGHRLPQAAAKRLARRWAVAAAKSPSERLAVLNIGLEPITQKEQFQVCHVALFHHVSICLLSSCLCVSIWLLTHPVSQASGHQSFSEKVALCACRGGIVRVPNVKYNAKQLILQPRLAWRGAMQVDLLGLLMLHSVANMLFNDSV